MSSQNNYQIGNGNSNQQIDLEGAHILGRTLEKTQPKEPWFKKELVKTILWIIGTLTVAGVLAYFGLK